MINHASNRINVNNVVDVKHVTISGGTLGAKKATCNDKVATVYKHVSVTNMMADMDPRISRYEPIKSTLDTNYGLLDIVDVKGERSDLCAGAETGETAEAGTGGGGDSLIEDCNGRRTTDQNKSHTVKPCHTVKNCSTFSGIVSGMSQANCRNEAGGFGKPGDLANINVSGDNIYAELSGVKTNNNHGSKKFSIRRGDDRTNFVNAKPNKDQGGNDGVPTDSAQFTMGRGNGRPEIINGDTNCENATSVGGSHLGSNVWGRRHVEAPRGGGDAICEPQRGNDQKGGNAAPGDSDDRYGGDAAGATGTGGGCVWPHPVMPPAPMLQAAMIT